MVILILLLPLGWLARRFSSFLHSLSEMDEFIHSCDRCESFHLRSIRMSVKNEDGFAGLAWLGWLAWLVCCCCSFKV